MDPEIVDLIAGMPDADRQQLSADMGAWANHHGVELTDQIAEDYVRGAYAADQAAEAEPPALTYEQHAMAGYAANHEQAAQEAQAGQIAVDQAHADARQFEQQLGRVLTGREREQLFEAQAAQVFRGEPMNVQDAAATAGIRGWGEMDEREAAETMVERMDELAGPEPDLEVPVRHSPYTGQREVDWGEMTTDDQNAYMAARLGGAELDPDEQ